HGTLQERGPGRDPRLVAQAIDQGDTSDGHRRAGVHRAAALETMMFSLHVDTARTWRGGQNQVLLTVNGLRSIGHRAALAAHPDGELRRRADEGLELIPIAPRTEMDLSAAWKFSRVIKRLQPDVIHAHDPHGVAMASLALSIGSASAREKQRPALVAARRVDFHLKGNSSSR